MKTVEQYLKDNERSKNRRKYYETQWQLVCEYIHQRRADFTSSESVGAFINSQIWTDQPIHIAETAASTFLGYVWSNGAKSFRLIPDPNVFGDSKVAEEFFANATKSLQAEMSEEEAGLDVAMDESMLDLLTLGTDAIFTDERNQDQPQLGCLRYEPWTILELSIAEGKHGRPEMFYRVREMTIRHLIETYGIDNVSDKSRDMFKRGATEECVKVLHVIEPRSEKDMVKNSLAAKDMPIASVHIEMDANHICRNSGFQEPRVACARLSKRIQEEYGRGKGMNALPSIMMLNQVFEDYMLAMEKSLDPPMYQLNDAVSGNGYIDSSAGAINILRVDKAQGNIAPTGKLFDIQEPRSAPEVINLLVETISNHFMIDRLLNMNNDVQMTRGEAFLRNSIRQSSLRSVSSRVINEKHNVLINASFLICLRRNKFGYMPNSPEARALESDGIEVNYIPDEIVRAIEAQENLYQIEYLTPAARDLMAEEGQGMLEMLAVIGDVTANLDQNARHRVNVDWTLNRLAQINGADHQMLNSQEDYEKAVAFEQEKQAEAQQLESAKAIAGVAKDAAIAQNTASE